MGPPEPGALQVGGNFQDLVQVGAAVQAAFGCHQVRVEAREPASPAE